MRLKHVSVQSEMPFLKLPSPITGLFPQLLPSPGNSFQKFLFHLANFYPSFVVHLHCSSSRKPSPTPQKRLLSNLGQVQRGHLSTLSDYMIYPITCQYV